MVLILRPFNLDFSPFYFTYFGKFLLQHLQDGSGVRGPILVDPVTQAAVSAGISASDVSHSVVETVVSTTLSHVPVTQAQLAAEAVGIQHGQVHIMEVADGTTAGAVDVQAAIGEALQTGHVTVEASDSLGITVPAEILAAMAAAQSHPHLLIASADQQLMQAQVAEQEAALRAGAELPTQAANETIQSTESVPDQGVKIEATASSEQHEQELEQPMDTD